jgi:bleomycin hydrolase
VELPIGDYVCLVTTRAVQPGRPDLHGRVPRQRARRTAGHLPQRRHAGDQGHRRADAQGGEPVWFGCDVGKMMSNDYAVWDAGLYDLSSVYDTAFTLDKADRLAYHETQMTHAMLFTGVDVLDGVPRGGGWRTAGARQGQGRLLHDERLVVRRVRLRDRGAPQRALPEELQRALDAEPIVLPAWDPMGALAH